MRIAVTQFATSLNSQENLASCLRMIDDAAVCKPKLIVLPEYCNSHCYSVQLNSEQENYLDHNQAWDEAISLDGTFMVSVAERAKRHNCYIALNVTVRRDIARAHQNPAIRSNISITSCLISPTGELVQQHSRSQLSNEENEFFISATNTAQLSSTPFGTIALVDANDSTSFKNSRNHATAGAQLLCQSTSTFLRDNSEIFAAARSSENNLFVAIANKVTPFESANIRENESLNSTCLEEYLANVCQSQIIATDGTVLAEIAHNKTGFAFADIDLSHVGLSEKVRTDGTNVKAQLRPELYQDANVKVASCQSNKIPDTANVAIFATYKDNEQAIEDVCFYIENNLSDIIQLPELFFVSDKSITHDSARLIAVEDLCQQLVEQVSAMLRPFQYVCTSIVIDGAHQAVLINEHGIFAQQPQLHFCQRYQWTALGDVLNIIELPLEQGNIKLAMLTADDANIPELVHVAGLKGIHLLLAPFDIQSANEVEFSLLAQAAKHKFCVVAATREKSLKKSSLKNGSHDKTEKSTGFIASLAKEQELSSVLHSKKFNGYLNKPIVKQQYGKITKALIHPILAHKCF